MAKSVLSSSDIALTSAFGTTYYTVLGLAGTSLETTEAFAQITYHTAGTLSDIYCYISSNDINGASTLRVRINGGNGTQSVSVTAATTGHFVDATPSNTDAVADGDEVNYSWVTGGSSGTAFLRQTACGFTPASGTFVQYASTHQTAQVKNTTNYWGLSGNIGNNNTTEARAQGEINSGNVTFQNLFVYVSANTVGLNSTVALRDDASSVISVSITASTTGIFEETSTSATPATNSLMAFLSTAANNGTSITFKIISIGATSTDSTYLSPSDNSNGSNTSTNPLFFAINGNGNSSTSNSSGLRQVRISANLSNVVVNISGNTADGTSTFAIEVDGSDSVVAASIGATLTGNFEDTDSVAVTTSQTIIYHMTRGGTGTITSRSMCCTITNTEVAASGYGENYFIIT